MRPGPAAGGRKLSEPAMPQEHKYRYDAALLAYINRLFGSHPGDEVFGGYLLYLNTEADVSPRTQTLYVKDLFGTYQPDKNFIRSAEFTFFNYLSLKDITGSPQINRELMRSYIVWLSNNHIANASINRRLSAVRSFFKFLIISGRALNSPLPVATNRRNSPRSSLSVKTDRRLPRFLTLSEIEKLLNMPDLSRPEGRRDRAILELFYAAGLRLSELRQMDLPGLNPESREIRVLGKGGKERMVVIGLPAAAALKAYIEHGRPQLSAGSRDSALFLNHRGKRLSMRGVQKLIKHYSLAAGLEKNVHPHVLRHTFATHMLNGGADLRVVQELLGHADLSTTQIYTHVTKQQARKVYLAAHPLAGEKEGPDESRG